MSSGGLDGRIALVAGAGGGAERAIAARLEADGAGVRVCDHDAALERAVGSVDILIPVAPAASVDAFAERDRERWWREVDASLWGAFRLVRAVVPGMKRARRGRIVIVTSDAGLRPRPGATTDSAAAAGSIAFGKTLARELAPSGILVNVVARAETGAPQPAVDAAVAATVAFLASDRAGAFVGQVLEPSAVT